MITVKLHTKFLVLVLGILVLFSALLAFVVVQRETLLLNKKNAEKEHLLARAIVTGLKNNMLAGKPRNTQLFMDGLRGEYDLVRLEVLRRDGTPAFGRKGPRIIFPQIDAAFINGEEISFTENGPVLLHTNIFPLKNEDVCKPCHSKAGPILGVILTSHSLENTMREVQTSKQQLIFLLSGAVLFVGISVYIAVRRLVLLPLKTLHQGAEVVGGGNLDHQINISGSDEFHDLAVSFNVMAGRLKKSYAELEDIVKIRTAELNKSVRLMRGILSSMSSGVLLLSRDGEIKLINRQGAFILGCGHEDVLSRKIADIVPETAAFLSARMGSYDEITIRGVEGRELPIGFTVSSYAGNEGEQEGIIVVFQDLTELKTLQSELVSKERFAAMGRIVAGVAHEIRNPLFGISAIGQIFERDLTDQGHQELARALLTETKRLNQLVEELLIYGRPMKLNLVESDLRMLWEEILDMHRDELKRRKIRIVGDYAVRHPTVFFDPYQIRQVFLNLLRNAMEATADGGTIAITMLIEDKNIVFKVADTGSGIPKEHIDHVFDLFFTTKPKGTGLGLAICRKIMQDHGGDILIESEEGKGTVVTVRLPYLT